MLAALKEDQRTVRKNQVENDLTKNRAGLRSGRKWSNSRRGFYAGNGRRKSQGRHGPSGTPRPPAQGQPRAGVVLGDRHRGGGIIWAWSWPRRKYRATDTQYRPPPSAIPTRRNGLKLRRQLSDAGRRKRRRVSIPVRSCRPSAKDFPVPYKHTGSLLPTCPSRGSPIFGTGGRSGSALQRGDRRLQFALQRLSVPAERQRCRRCRASRQTALARSRGARTRRFMAVEHTIGRARHPMTLERKRGRSIGPLLNTKRQKA